MASPRRRRPLTRCRPGTRSRSRAGAATERPASCGRTPGGATSGLRRGRPPVNIRAQVETEDHRHAGHTRGTMTTAIAPSLLGYTPKLPLYEHQTDAVARSLRAKGFYLAADPGTGKSAMIVHTLAESFRRRWLH